MFVSSLLTFHQSVSHMDKPRPLDAQISTRSGLRKLLTCQLRLFIFLRKEEGVSEGGARGQSKESQRRDSSKNGC